MIYRVHYASESESSNGFDYFATKHEAEQALARWRQQRDGDSAGSDIECAPVPKTKAAMIALLKDWGGHADNG